MKAKLIYVGIGFLLVSVGACASPTDTHLSAASVGQASTSASIPITVSQTSTISTADSFPAITKSVDPRAILTQPDPFRGLGAPVEGEKRYAAFGAVVVPASGEKAAVSSDQAYDVAINTGMSQHIVNSEDNHTVQLVYYTNIFGADGADGQMVPSVPRQLAWMIEFTKDEPANSAGSGDPNAVATTASMLHCTIDVAVSAQKATQLDSFSTCQA